MWNQLSYCELIYTVKNVFANRRNIWHCTTWETPMHYHSQLWLTQTSDPVTQVTPFMPSLSLLRHWRVNKLWQGLLKDSLHERKLSSFIFQMLAFLKPSSQTNKLVTNLAAPEAGVSVAWIQKLWSQHLSFQSSRRLIIVLRPIYMTENFWHGSDKNGTRIKKSRTIRRLHVPFSTVLSVVKK